MRTHVYVDGFNLYYRALRSRPHCRWLDLKALVTNVLPPGVVVEAIHYYTARVSSRVDADAPRKQQLYLSALDTLPEVTIHYGNFLFSEKWARLVTPLPDGTQSVLVQKVEEKGSDVNLGSHLVNDAWRGVFEQAVVISKDTDLIEPIRIVTQERGKPVGILCPDKGLPPGLAAVASFSRFITKAHLNRSQFPDPVVDASGVSISKPIEWVPPPPPPPPPTAAPPST